MCVDGWRIWICATKMQTRVKNGNAMVGEDDDDDYDYDYDVVDDVVADEDDSYL